MLQAARLICSRTRFNSNTPCAHRVHIPGMRIRFWPRKRTGALYLKQRRFEKVYWMNMLDNIKSLFFCFHTFGGRRTIYVLDSENQPGSGKIGTGSGALGLTGDVWHQKYKNIKEAVKNYLTYLFRRLLKISLSLRYRDPDPVFGQNRILIPAIYSTKNLRISVI